MVLYFLLTGWGKSRGLVQGHTSGVIKHLLWSSSCLLALSSSGYLYHDSVAFWSKTYIFFFHMLSFKETTDASYWVPLRVATAVVTSLLEGMTEPGLVFRSVSCCCDYWMHTLKTNNKYKTKQTKQTKKASHPTQQIIKQIMPLPPRSAEKQQALHGVESNGCNIKTTRNKPGSNSWKPGGKQPSNALGIMGLNDRSLWFIVLNVLIFICPLQHSALSPERFDNGLFAVT